MGGTVRPSEKQIQNGIFRLLRMLGWAVYDLSQPRNTMQTPGLPDGLAFGHGRTLFVEVKRRPNKPTPWQTEFGANVEEGEGTWVVWYSVEDAKDWLRDHGLLRAA